MDIAVFIFTVNQSKKVQGTIVSAQAMKVRV
jgi:hypothetical protein